MEANFRYNRTRFIDDTVRVDIPDNDVARLMYYLHCLSCVINNNEINQYTSYHNYFMLSNQDIDNVIELSRKFNPEEMIKAGIFVIKEDLDMNNRFIKITNETMNIHTNEDIVIAGMHIKALKIMLLRSQWAIIFYYLPIKRLTQSRLYPPFQNIIYPPIPYIPQYNYPTNNDDQVICDCCTIF